MNNECLTAGSLPSFMQQIFPLSDQAALVYFCDETAALQFALKMRQASSLPWLIDVVQAYASVAVHFDLEQTTFASVSHHLHIVLRASSTTKAEQGATHEIPCCYEMGPDLARVAAHVHLSCEQVIAYHLSMVYTVYAIGFCPGFPYLGYLPAPLCGVPRLPAPRLSVAPGSVGLTGRQTGIYPEARPGGWNLIGRTPLLLVDLADSYFPLKTGDRMRFARIDALAFRELFGQRIVVPRTDLLTSID